MKQLFFYSLARRCFIEAKYVQKAFLRPLPASNQIRPSTRTIKRWSVMKNSVSAANASNDTDDDTMHTLKISNRQIFHRFVIMINRDNTKILLFLLF